MRVEILHIDDCPNWQEAGRRTQEALIRTGHGEHVSYCLLATAEQASAAAFAGSPTITVDGADLFPSEGQTGDLACRIYFTSDGIAGLPELDQIVESIRAYDEG
ncbi:MAG: thioredoxin family protein [Leifsonia sp.]